MHHAIILQYSGAYFLSNSCVNRQESTSPELRSKLHGYVMLCYGVMVHPLACTITPHNWLRPAVHATNIFLCHMTPRVNKERVYSDHMTDSQSSKLSGTDRRAIIESLT